MGWMGKLVDTREWWTGKEGKEERRNTEEGERRGGLHTHTYGLSAGRSCRLLSPQTGVDCATAS